MIYSQRKTLVVEFYVHISAPDIKRILNWKEEMEYLSATAENIVQRQYFHA